MTPKTFQDPPTIPLGSSLLFPLRTTVSFKWQSYAQTRQEQGQGVPSPGESASSSRGGCAQENVQRVASEELLSPLCYQELRKHAVLELNWFLPVPPFNPLGLGRGSLQLWASWHNSPLLSWHWVLPRWACAQSAMHLLCRRKQYQRWFGSPHSHLLPPFHSHTLPRAFCGHFSKAHFKI